MRDEPAARRTVPDVEWAVTELERFITMVEPVRDVSGSIVIGQKGSENDIVAQQDVVESILNRFFPEWRKAVPVSMTDRWRSHSEAAKRCGGW
jgi:hypothetical protein